MNVHHTWKYGLRILGVLFIVSYFLNFVWESFHAVFLYEKHDISSRDYVLMMNFVSLLDACVILVMYVVMAAGLKDFDWLRMVNKYTVHFFLLGLGVAYLIEYFMVYVVHGWSYNSNMPLVFNVGLSPLLQLSITGLGALHITKKIFQPFA